MQKATIKLILASNSPRRQELLRSGGYRFKVQPSLIAEPEPRSPNQIPSHWAEALSYFKARSVAKDLDDGYVLAADTIVALGTAIIGKPAGADDARRMLQELQGTTHRVISGLTLLHAADSRRWIGHDTTTVTMKPMSEEVLDAYIAGGLWKGKAGAYGIQDRSDANIECIEGSYSNVVGLPLELLEQMLRACGILDHVLISPDPRA